MKEYIESLNDTSDILSGDVTLLPPKLYEKWEIWRDLVDTFQAEKWAMATEDRKSSEKAIAEAGDKYYSELKNGFETYLEQQQSKPRSPTADYLDSLQVENDIFSGNPDLLPKSLQERFKNLIQLEYDFFYDHPNEESPHQEAFKHELDKFNADWKRQSQIAVKMETLIDTNVEIKENRHQQKSDMSAKKTTQNDESLNEQAAKKKEPQLVTVNGDKITHAHAFKSNVSEDWFYTAKINGISLKAQVMDKNDVERVLDKSANVQEMMQKYYPAVLQPKVSPAEFKLPKAINTANGEEQILKFNVYKEDDPNNISYGKYRFYAQVGDKKMSAEASKQDLDTYFNRVATPVQLVSKNFGDRLGMKEHYEQFKLPEALGIETKDIRLAKNQQTNRYEISVKLPNQIQTSAKEISYDDRQSYFQHKAASKEQLAAKYLMPEITSLSSAPKMQTQHQMGVAR